MTTAASETPILDMELAFWSWLTSENDYVDLGLKEYRGYDGSVLPFDPQKGLFAASHLPAISLEIENWGRLDATGQPSDEAGSSPTGYSVAAKFAGSLVFPGTPTGRESVEKAMSTLLALLDSRSRRVINVAKTPGVIADYRIVPGELRAYRPTSSGKIEFWDQQFALVLQSHRRAQP